MGPYYAVLCLLVARAHCSCGPNAEVVALLGLREGQNCSQLRLGGVQQAAALEAAVQAVNRNLGKNGLHLGMRVFDTCSDPQRTLSVTLRAMVLEEKACPQPPMFLGFVGPDDADSLLAVQRVTRVFNMDHIIPFGVQTHMRNTFYIANEVSVEAKAQAVMALIQRLEWPVITLVHTSDIATSQQASVLARLASESGVCLLTPPSALHNSEDQIAYRNIMNTMQEYPRVPTVILAGDDQPVTGLFNFLSTMTQEGVPRRVILVAANTAGLLPEVQRFTLDGTIVVMQDTSWTVVPEFENHLSNSSLWALYLEERGLTACSPPCSRVKEMYADIQDPSVLPLTHAVNLVAAAFRSVRDALCGSVSGPCPALRTMTPAQWRKSLTSTRLETQASESNIAFRMNIPSKTVIFVKANASHTLEKVGYIVNGTDLNVSLHVPYPQESSNVDVAQCFDVTLITPPTNSDDVTTHAPSVRYKNVYNGTRVYSIAEYRFYHTVGLLTGAGIGMFLFFVMCIVIVYRNFRFDNKERSSEGS